MTLSNPAQSSQKAYREILRLEIGITPASVPKANNFNGSPVVIYSIENSVRSYDNLAKALIIKFRYDSTSVGELPQALGMSNQELAKFLSAVNIVD